MLEPFLPSLESQNLQTVLVVAILVIKSLLVYDYQVHRWRSSGSLSTFISSDWLAFDAGILEISIRKEPVIVFLIACRGKTRCERIDDPWVTLSLTIMIECNGHSSSLFLSRLCFSEMSFAVFCLWYRFLNVFWYFSLKKKSPPRNNSTLTQLSVLDY